MMEIDTEQIKEAWDRIARTSDGLVVYRHLQRLRLGLATDYSALPHFEGRRSLAADLMALMADGIGENDRAAITFSFSKSVAPAERSRGAGRRIGPEHFVPGYDAPAEPFRAPGGASDTGSGSNGSGSGTGGA
jgi:hypothetical protein